jgi:hypothetical protein
MYECMYNNNNNNHVYYYMSGAQYRQYCTISFMGGSYVCSPIKGPISTTTAVGSIENKNRGVTHVRNGQPEKFGVADSGATFSTARKMWRTTPAPVPGQVSAPISGNHNHKYTTPMDTAAYISSKKTVAVGKGSTNRATETLSYKGSADSSTIGDVGRAVRRTRNSGYVVSKGAQRQFVSPGIGGTAGSADSVGSSSLKSPSMKMSSFTPSRLLQRVGCDRLCDE